MGAEHLIVHYFLHWVREQRAEARAAEAEREAGEWQAHHQEQFEVWRRSDAGLVASGYLGEHQASDVDVTLAGEQLHVIYASPRTPDVHGLTLDLEVFGDGGARIAQDSFPIGSLHCFCYVKPQKTSKFQLRVSAIRGAGEYRLKVATLSQIFVQTLGVAMRAEAAALMSRQAARAAQPGLHLNLSQPAPTKPRGSTAANSPKRSRKKRSS